MRKPTWQAYETELGNQFVVITDDPSSVSVFGQGYKSISQEEYTRNLDLGPDADLNDIQIASKRRNDEERSRGRSEEAPGQDDKKDSEISDDAS